MLPLPGGSKAPRRAVGVSARRRSSPRSLGCSIALTRGPPRPGHGDYDPGGRYENGVPAPLPGPKVKSTDV